MAPGKRSLAIKFPPKDQDTTAHPVEEKDGDTKRQDPAMIKPASLVANGSATRGLPSLSLLSEKGDEVKGSKKRQSPCENFEPWSGVRGPVKKAPRTESSFISHSNSVMARSPIGSSKNNHSAKNKSVYASASRKDVYGDNSVERRGNVQRSATGGATKQGEKSELKRDPAVKSISEGMKELTLHSGSEIKGKSSSSNRSPALKIKSLQAGHSKFQITGTQVSPPSNAGRTTGTKSLSSSSSTSHKTNRTDLKIHGVLSRSSSLGASSASTKQTVTASSTKGRGRGRGEVNTSSSINSSRVSRQSNSTGSTVPKGKGRGVGSPSTLHSTNTGRDTKPKQKHVRKNHED